MFYYGLFLLGRSAAAHHSATIGLLRAPLRFGRCCMVRACGAHHTTTAPPAHPAAIQLLFPIHSASVCVSVSNPQLLPIVSPTCFCLCLLHHIGECNSPLPIPHPPSPFHTLIFSGGHKGTPLPTCSLTLTLLLSPHVPSPALHYCLYNLSSQ